MLALADSAGMQLLPFQRSEIEHAFQIDAAGKWAAFEVLWVISRRNGKSYMIAVRVLAGLFLFDEQEIMWTSHRYDAAMEAFKLISGIIKATPWMKAQLARTRNNGISTKNGEEQIKLATGATVKFKTRTPDSGRALDGDLVIVDEVQNAQPAHLGALLPTVAARPNPQVVYAGSAGDTHSVIEGELLHRAFKAPEGERRLMVAGWSADESDDPAAEKVWARTNPAYGYRIEPTTFHGLYAANRFRPHWWFREHLGRGNYPVPEGEDWIIPSSAWSGRLADPDAPLIVGQGLLAAEAKTDQTRASVSMAGFRADGAVQIQLVAAENGTRWVVDQIGSLMDDLDAIPTLVIDPKGPLQRWIPDLESLGVDLLLLSRDDMVDATAWVLEAAGTEPPTDDAEAALWVPPLRHTEQIPMTTAVANVQLRSTSERPVLSRLAGEADPSPFLAAVWAAYGLVLQGRTAPTPPAPQGVPGAAPATTGLDVRNVQF